MDESINKINEVDMKNGEAGPDELEPEWFEPEDDESVKIMQKLNRRDTKRFIEQIRGEEWE